LATSWLKLFSVCLYFTICFIRDAAAAAYSELIMMCACWNRKCCSCMLYYNLQILMSSLHTRNQVRNLFAILVLYVRLIFLFAMNKILAVRAFEEVLSSCQIVTWTHDGIRHPVLGDVWVVAWQPVLIFASSVNATLNYCHLRERSLHDIPQLIKQPTIAVMSLMTYVDGQLTESLISSFRPYVWLLELATYINAFRDNWLVQVCGCFLTKATSLHVVY
jgi:hypothetical protein